LRKIEPDVNHNGVLTPEWSIFILISVEIDIYEGGKGRTRNERPEDCYCCGYRRLSQANCDNRRHYNQDLIENTVMEMIDEFLLQQGYIENQLQHQLELVEKQRQESKAEIEDRIDTSLELLVDGRVPKERVIIKMQDEIKALTVEDLEVFRNQLRSKVEGELDIDTKKSILNSLIKKLKVDQDGLVEIDFCVALGNTLYGINACKDIPFKQRIRRV